MSSVPLLIIAAACSQCCNAATHQISRANVAFKQHIKAAMLIGGGALYTALFAAAEQVASNPNDGHEGV